MFRGVEPCSLSRELICGGLLVDYKRDSVTTWNANSQTCMASEKMKEGMKSRTESVWSLCSEVKENMSSKRTIREEEMPWVIYLDAHSPGPLVDDWVSDKSPRTYRGLSPRGFQWERYLPGYKDASQGWAEGGGMREAKKWTGCVVAIVAQDGLSGDPHRTSCPAGRKLRKGGRGFFGVWRGCACEKSLGV